MCWIADKADPFTKKRLLALADRYDARSGTPSRAVRQLPSVSINGQKHASTATAVGMRANPWTLILMPRRMSNLS